MKPGFRKRSIPRGSIRLITVLRHGKRRYCAATVPVAKRTIAVHGRVGGVVTEPLPPQTRACAIDALGSSPDRFAQEVSSLIRRLRKTAPSPVRLSTAVSCTCLWNSAFPPAFPISGSVQVTPRFPPAGPEGHGSPPSQVLSRRYDFLPSHVLRLIVFASRFHGCLSEFVSASGGPAAVQARRRAGVWIYAGNPLPASLPVGVSRTSQVPRRSIP